MPVGKLQKNDTGERPQKGAHMLKLRHRFYLQAFAEGLDSAGDVGGAEGSTDTGLANQSDADGDLFEYSGNSLEGTSYEAPTASPDENGASASDDWQSIREKYRENIGEEIQSAIQRRFKNQQSYEDSYNSLVEGLAPLFLKYGLDGSDIDGLKDALSKDDSLLEDMAFNEGLTPEAVRERMQQRQENERLQRELNRMREEQAQEQASRDAYNQYNAWLQEAEQLKKEYPNFDLTKELENEDFKNDIISGKSVKKAFQSAHLDEILQGAIQTTAKKAIDATVNNIRARGMRPAENGQRMGSVSVKKDVKDLTDKDIDRIIKRAKAGELITF